jgi:hypothetical protein
VLLGVAALVARFWAYHRWYDDVLIFVPMVALLRDVRSVDPAGPSRHLAAVLLVLLAGLGAAPASILHLPSPWSDLFKAAKTATWLATLGYLLWLARRRPAAAVAG